MSAPTHPPTCVCTACNPSARKSAYEQVIEGLEARLNTAFQRIEQLEQEQARHVAWLRLPSADKFCLNCGTVFACPEHKRDHTCTPRSK